MATGLYPGIGQPLYLASSGNPQEPDWSGFPSAYKATIPNGSSTLGVPLNAGITTSLNVLFATAPAGTAFSIKYDVVPTFANEVTLDTVAASGTDKVYTWSTEGNVELDGFIRITNSGGQSISGAWCQQRARTVG